MLTQYGSAQRAPDNAPGAGRGIPREFQTRETWERKSFLSRKNPGWQYADQGENVVEAVGPLTDSPLFLSPVFRECALQSTGQASRREHGAAYQQEQWEHEHQQDTDEPVGQRERRSRRGIGYHRYQAAGADEKGQHAHKHQRSHDQEHMPPSQTLAQQGY